MASLFGRVRRRRSAEEDGEDCRSGSGRATRRRLSPEVDASSPAESSAAEGSSPGWLSSFVSGARRVISSVLFSSPEEGAAREDDEEDNNGLSSDENVDVHETHGAIVSYSESKLAIEQMLLKETFSRDECDKMIKLVQSRVTESPYAEPCKYETPKEIPKRTAGASHDFTGAWRSFNHKRNFPESDPFSSGGIGRFSPGSPLQASPELCNVAIMEAKKWLEEKRQGLSSKPEDHGPCTLNTDMLNSGFESDMGSPVDLAKSYMQSLPPWQSPLVSSQKFKTPPSSGLHIYDVEGNSIHSLSSPKVTKQGYLSTFWENLEESRRARLGSSGSSLDMSKSRQYGSTSKLFENDTSVFSSGSHEKHRESLQNNQDTLGSDKAAAAHPTNGSSLPNVGSSDPTTATVEPLSGDQTTVPTASTKDGNDGFVNPLDPAKEDNVQECCAASEVHPIEVAQGNIISPTSTTKDVADHSGTEVQAATTDPKIHEESHVNLVSELRAKDAGPQIQTIINGSTNKTSTNGLLDQSNANSGLESSGNDNPSCTNSSNAVPLTSNEFTESPANAAGNNHVENGVGSQSVEPVPEEPKRNYVRRGRKRVVRSIRGRGK